MNLSDLLILLSIIEFSSHIFAKLQLCIGYRITSTHSCAEDFKLEPVSFCSRIYTVCKVLKFIYSERARKVETIFLLNLTLFFLAFSEILNFTCHIFFKNCGLLRISELYRHKPWFFLNRERKSGIYVENGNKKKTFHDLA